MLFLLNEAFVTVYFYIFAQNKNMRNIILIVSVIVLVVVIGTPG